MRLLLSVFILHFLIQNAYADQLQDRVLAARQLQKAEENQLLCQAGSPKCVPSTASSHSLQSTNSSLPPLPTISSAGVVPQRIIPMSNVNVPTSPSSNSVVKKSDKPRSTGLIIIGDRKFVEVEFIDKKLVMKEGDVINSWRLISFNSGEVVWSKIIDAKKNSTLKRSAANQEKSSSSTSKIRQEGLINGAVVKRDAILSGTMLNPMVVK